MRELTFIVAVTLGLFSGSVVGGMLLRCIEVFMRLASRSFLSHALIDFGVGGPH